MSILPAPFGIVEPIKFDQAVDLLRDRGLQVPNVIVVIPERLQLGFDPFVFDEAGTVVTLEHRNRNEVPTKDHAFQARSRAGPTAR